MRGHSAGLEPPNFESNLCKGLAKALDRKSPALPAQNFDRRYESIPGERFRCQDNPTAIKPLSYLSPLLQLRLQQSTFQRFLAVDRF
jgi:hypothetical protein